MHLLPSDHFKVSTAPNFEHYECKFTIHLPVGKRVALRILKMKNETLETSEVSCTGAKASSLLICHSSSFFLVLVFNLLILFQLQ